MINVEADIVR